MSAPPPILARARIRPPMLGSSRRLSRIARLSRRKRTPVSAGSRTLSRGDGRVGVAALVAIRALARLLKVMAGQVLIAVAVRARAFVPTVAAPAAAVLAASSSRGRRRGTVRTVTLLTTVGRGSGGRVGGARTRPQFAADLVAPLAIRSIATAARLVEVALTPSSIICPAIPARVAGTTPRGAARRPLSAGAGGAFLLTTR